MSLFLLLRYENIPIFCGVWWWNFQHCANTLSIELWFMTYLFSFHSAYLSFGTFHFSRCQGKNQQNERREPLALSVTLFIIWQIKVLCACVFVDNWFFWRTFRTKLPIHTYAVYFVCVFLEGKGSTEKKIVLSIYYHFERMYKKSEKRKLLHKHSCYIELERCDNISFNPSQFFSKLWTSKRNTQFFVCFWDCSIWRNRVLSNKIVKIEVVQQVQCFFYKSWRYKYYLIGTDKNQNTHATTAA